MRVFKFPVGLIDDMSAFNLHFLVERWRGLADDALDV
jgi:hypothetical protein